MRLTVETCSVGPAAPTLCRAWRINVAHDLKNVDPVTDVPLAAQVCYNVAGLQFSVQADTFQNILSYQAGDAVGAGPLLSALCAFMWFTKVPPPPPLVPGLCSPRSALSCGSRRCRPHRAMRTCVGCRSPSRVVLAVTCATCAGRA
jgi:hypothetical protein